MATVSTLVDSTAYVSISGTGTAFVTNESSEPVRIAFAAAPPAVDTTEYLTLPPNQGLIQDSNIPAGTIYARADKAGYTSKVTVS